MCVKKPFLAASLIVGLGLLSAERLRAQYTFGTEFQSTNTASITDTSGTFQYTDNPNASNDYASLPLAGSTAGLISSTNSWHASISVNCSAKTVTATASQSPDDGMGLSVVYFKGETQYFVTMTAGQVNNTGGAYDADYPDGLYGTGAHFIARIAGANEPTTPLGKSFNVNGDSILYLTGATNTPAATEPLDAIAAVVTLSYSAATETVAGYYNGIAVGSYSIAGWASNPPLTLYVLGASGQSLAITTGEDTATNFNASAGTFGIPQLAIIQTAPNLVLSWPTNATGFMLQSATDLASRNWTAVSTSPVVVSTNNVVTNTISGPLKFYRLSQ